MKIASRLARSEPRPIPERAAAPRDVGRTWAVLGVTAAPLALTVLCLRPTVVAQPSALFALALPALCAGGAFTQRRRALLLGATARGYRWVVRLVLFGLLAALLALSWLPHAAAVGGALAFYRDNSGVAPPDGVAFLLAGPANLALAALAWWVGRRLYRRMAALDVQPWEGNDEALRTGRQRLVGLLWHDVVAGALLLAVDLEVLWQGAADAQGRAAVAAVTVAALAAYVGGSFTVMARLTGLARRTAGTLEGVTFSGAQPSPWTRPVARGLAAAAVVLALLAASPVVGLLHAGAFWLGRVVIVAASNLFVAALASLALAALRHILAIQWAPHQTALSPPSSVPDSATTSGPSTVVGLLVVFLLSWLIWWVAVRLLDRLPSLARAVAPRRRARPWRALWTLLRGWFRRGQEAAAASVTSYRLRRGARTVAHEGSLEGLPPRALVLAAYRRALRRAAALGWRRPAAQTPTEFAAQLPPHSPAAEALVELTDAFAEARYSIHPITPERAGHALTLWKRLRRALRRTP